MKFKNTKMQRNSGVYSELRYDGEENLLDKIKKFEEKKDF